MPFEQKERSQASTDKNNIHKIDHFRDILTKCTYNSFIVLDLDNTVLEPTEELGSDQWFEQMIKTVMPSIQNISKANELILTLYYAVQQHIHAKTTEDNINAIIYTLQKIGLPIIALTARGLPIIDATIRQLGEVGIDFSNQKDNGRMVLGQGEKGIDIIYHKGIVFCTGQDKGCSLERLFEYLKIPFPDVVMVDDKEKNLHLVKDIVEKHGRHFEGCRDGFLDEKASKVDLVRANNHLLRIKDLLSEDAKNIIKQFNILPADEKRNQSLSALSIFSNEREKDDGVKIKQSLRI